MRIFVSYRRSDTQDFAGRLADRLRETPGVRGVFLDVDRIAPGEVFETRLKSALEHSDACLIVIGPDWRGARNDGSGPRIAQTGDFVRMEVAQALSGKSRVIPILANGAVMPAPGELPEDLAGLVGLNAVSVRHSDFDRDVDYLLDVLFDRRKPGRWGAYFARHPMQANLLGAIGGLFASMVALVAAAAIHFSLTGRSLDEAVGGPGPTVILIVVVLLAGLTAPGLIGNLMRRRARL